MGEMGTHQVWGRPRKVRWGKCGVTKNLDNAISIPLGCKLVMEYEVLFLWFASDLALELGSPRTEKMVYDWEGELKW